MHLVLIGMRGCGKTTVGRIAARSLGWEFIDTDERIIRLTGESISDLFARRGESAFREIESAAIDDSLRSPPKVISVGGGAILSEPNRALLRSDGFCVWLRATVDTLADRVRLDPASAQLRPSLTGCDAVTELADVLKVREALYAHTAHAVVDADSKSPEEVTAVVLREFAAIRTIHGK